MADVSFSVDVILNMVNKGINTQLKQIDSTTKSLSNNTKSLGFNLNNLPSKNLQYLFKPLDEGTKSANNISDAIGKAKIAYSDFGSVTPVNQNAANSTNQFARAIDTATKNMVPYQSAIGSSAKALQGYVQNLELVERAYGKGSPQANAYFNGIVKGTQFTSKELKTAQKNLAGFSFSFLSLIFGGVALQKIFGGAFKSLRDGYLEVADETDLFRKKTEGLADSFSLLKFTVFDAFANSDIIQWAIDGISTAITGLADVMERNPALGTAITTLFGALGLIGGTLFTVGTFQQLFMAGGSFQSMNTALKNFSNLNTKKIVDNADNVEKSVNKLSKLQTVSLVIGIALAGLAVKQSIDIFTDAKTSWNSRVKNIFTSVLAGAAIGFAFGPGGAIVGAVIGLSASIVTNIVDFSIESVKETQRQEAILEAVGLDSTLKIDSPLFIEFTKSEFYGTASGLQDFIDDIVNKQIIPFSEEINNLQQELDSISFTEGGKEVAGAVEQAEAFREEIERLTNIGVQTFGADFINVLSDISKRSAELKEGLTNDVENILPDISNLDVIQGVDVLKDLDVETFKTSLEEIKIPLQDFLSSFTGQAGLIVAVTDLLGATQGYVSYLPTLNEGLSTEGQNVDTLTKKYNDLAKAKREAGQTTRAEQSEQTGQSAGYYQYTSNGGGQSVLN